MAVLKCTVCGGELDVNADLSVGKCKFCDSVITIPKELDRKGNLYNRAVFLRQNNEFDKAMATYEDILKEDNSDAEAHWGLVLSKFGIEYVLDPKMQERIPTCHRTHSQSILSDPDYLAAIEYSDIEARRVIEDEAKRINKIQVKILEISQKEEPYDIFICYKESDELENRTEDSVLAQELYYELQKKGYRVFFARKTLESKLGTEYEPIIFAALNSAKVMIVLGTKAEYFNAVWVRNEWSRFIKMSGDAHKVIIPAYRGISPYELPAELSGFQSQDMSKIGFMQDLTDGIERCLRGQIEKRNTQMNGDNTESAQLERLLKNASTYLQLHSYSAAEEVYTTITENYPEDYHGWWGLIVCKTRNFSEILHDQTEINRWFGYVRQLADSKSFEEMKKVYVDYAEKTSLQKADEEIQAANRKICKYQNRINQQEALLLSAQNSKAAQNKNCQENIQNASDDKNQKEFDLENAKSRKKFYNILSTIVLILFITAIITAICLTVYGFATGGFLLGVAVAIVVAIVLGVPTFFISTFVLGGDAEAKEKLAAAETEVTKAKEKLSSMEAYHRNCIVSSNREIEDLQNNIAAIQKSISDCQKYIDLGQEKIAATWFHKLCKEFGVEQPLEEEILKCREAALGSENVQGENSLVEKKDSLEKNEISSVEEQLRQAIYHGDKQSIDHLLKENNDSYLNFVYKTYLNHCISNRQKEPYDMLLKCGVERPVSQGQCDLDCNYAKKYYLNPEDSDILPHAFQYLVDDFLRLHNIDLSHDKMAEQQIRGALFQSYQQLKAGQKVYISLPFIVANGQGPKHLEKSFSKHDFNAED